MLKLIIQKSFFVIIGFGLLTLGCNETKETQNAQAFAFSNSEYSVLMEDLWTLNEAIALKQVLKSAPDRTLRMINAAITQARAGVLLLAKTGERNIEDKRKAHTAFVNAIKQYEGFRVLEIEQERFDKVFNQVRYLKHLLSKELGITESEEIWTVFNHNFSTSGLEPTFTTMGFAKNGKPSDEAKWFTNFQTDLPKARAQGRDGSYGWMISRPFDLSEVDNPSFRYFGSYLVVAPNNVLSLAEVIRSVFKTYILLDYEPGDNPEEYSEDRKIFVEYNINDLPLGRDFDDAWVPSVSLTPYKDRKVAIGFLFDTRGINFTQYYSWTVFDFEINGAGKIKEDPVKYKEQFRGSNLGLYKSYSLEFPGEEWKADNGKALIRFMPTEENVEDKVDTFLLSPKLDIPKTMVSPTLKVQESFLTQTFRREKLIDYEIMISKNYHGGHSPLNAEWDVLERILDDNIERTAGERLSMTHEFSLEKYLGEEIVVAFRFKAQGHEVIVKDWSVESIQILGEEAKVAVIDYVVEEPSLAYRLSYVDFLSASVKDFTIEAEDGAPAWQKKPNGFIITGFGGPGNPHLLGASRLILPEINLVGKSDARIRLKQKVFHYRDDGVSSDVVKIHIRKKGDEAWAEFPVPTGTFRDGMPRDPELSSWIKIPEEYLGHIVEMSLWYKARSGNGGTAEWTMGAFEVGSK